MFAIDPKITHALIIFSKIITKKKIKLNNGITLNLLPFDVNTNHATTLYLLPFDVITNHAMKELNAANHYFLRLNKSCVFMGVTCTVFDNLFK